MSLRALRGGDAFDVEIKLQRRYDNEDELGVPQKIVEWILKVVGQADGLSPGKLDWRQIQQSLKDGVVLCRLINHLLKQVGQPTVHYRPKAATSFVAMANIDTFLTAARVYGVTEMSLFGTSDLYEGRKGAFLNVIHCINQLGKLANSRGFQPQYEGVPPPKPEYAMTNDDY
jgi:transgelin